MPLLEELWQRIVGAAKSLVAAKKELHHEQHNGSHSSNGRNSTFKTAAHALLHAAAAAYTECDAAGVCGCVLHIMCNKV